MIIYFRLVLVLFVTMFINGCATQQTSISAADLAKLRKVSTISVAAKTFNRQYVGFTVFNNENESRDISDWKIDKAIEININNELNKKYSLSAIETQYSTEEFEHVNDLNGPWDAPAFWGPNWEKIASSVKAQCVKNSLDALVVVARLKTADFLAGTNQTLNGAGIYTRGGLYQSAYMHFIAKVALYDCSTAKPIAIRYFSTQQLGHLGSILRSSPVQAINFEESKTPLANLTQEKTANIKSQLISLFTSAVPATIESIFSASQ